MALRHYRQSTVNLDKRRLAIAIALMATSVISAVATMELTNTPRLAALPLLLAVPSACLLVASMSDVWTRQRCEHLFFTLLLLCGSLSYALTFPPSTVPDEDSHARVAYVYANLVTPGYGATTMRAEDRDFLEHELVNNSQVTAERFLSTFQGARFTCRDNTPVTHDPLVTRELWGNDPAGHGLDYILSSSPFYVKAGATLGILIGRIFNLSALHSYYLGRICNAFFCCALVSLAVYLAPIGREAFMAASLLPMSLHEMGSFSYDGAIMGLCFVACALLLRAICGDEKVTRNEMIPICVALFLLGPCKMVYSLVAALGLLIPSRRFESRRHEVLCKLALLASPVVGVLAIRFDKVAALLFGGAGNTAAAAQEAHDHRGFTEGTFYSVSDVLHDPLGTAAMVWSTLCKNWYQYLFMMLGCSLGWLQPELLSLGMVWPLCLLLVAAALPAAREALPISAAQATWRNVARSARHTVLPDPTEDSPEETSPDVKTCIVSVVLFIALVITVMLGEMLIWTFNTESVIHGVQGRYFLPMLPLLLLPLARVRRMPQEAHDVILYVFCFVDVVYLISIFAALL